MGETGLDRAPGRGDADIRATKERIDWVDMARGASVLAVVLTHVCYRFVFPLAGSEAGRSLYLVWNRINYAILGHLRMPLLLFVSGWLAASKIREGWQARTRLSVFTNAYLYVLWTALYVAAEFAVPHPEGTMFSSSVHSWSELPAELLAPRDGPLWFVYALAILVTVLALARRLPAPLVLSALFVVGWIDETRHASDAPAWTGITHLGLYFALGVIVGPRVRDLVASRRVVVLGTLGLVLGGVLTAPKLLPPTWAYLANTAMRLGAVVCLLALSKALARWSACRIPAVWVGRRTLAIYLLHWPVIGALVLLAAGHADLLTAWEGVDWVVVASSLLIAAATAGICLVLEIGARRVGLNALFEPPERLRSLVARGARPSIAGG